MTTENIDAVIAEVFSAVLEKDIAAGENVARASEEKWDSLKHIEIIFAIEAALNVRFDEEDIAHIASVSDLKTKLAKKHAS